MSAVQAETPTVQPPGASKWSRRRKASVITAIMAFLVAAGLFLPAAVGGWAPVLHWTCQKGSKVIDEVTWIPVILINVPYGGYASGNGSLPAEYLGPNTLLPSADGTDGINGSVSGVIYAVWLNISTEQDVTTWGPGNNVRCTQAYTVAAGGTGPQPPGSYAGGIFGPGLRSDVAEPHVFTFGSGPSNQTVLFSNGFTAANSETISTCGGPAANRYQPVHQTNLVVNVPFAFAGSNHTASFVIPVEQSYHYMFPANFGIWQVDNLSEPGGPGGGWAFSYSPCQ